jgi:bacterioferritin
MEEGIVSDRESIIEMLQADMRDEHAALIQYLQHAYAMGEGEEACEIEAIAREEMRHFDWLAEAIVELGGTPDMTRGWVDLEGTNPAEWMERDVAAEERAIAQYKEHIAAIDDPTITRLLKRILSDEESHRGDFAHFVEKMAGVEQSDQRLVERRAEGAPSEVLDILQTGVQHEYTVILQYLYHDFVMSHCEVGRELEMQAINEMQHMGWLAEEVAELGGHPDMEHTALALEGDAAEMLEADIQAEREVTQVYNRQLEQLEDEGLHTLIARIRDHEIYHDELFSDLLEEVQAAEAEPEAPPAPEAPPEPVDRLTVGSLIKSDEEKE